MYYSTLERFQGVWLGSIIGIAFCNNSNKLDYHQIQQNLARFKHLIELRNDVAQIMLNNSHSQLIFQQINQIIEANYSNGCQNYFGDILDDGNYPDDLLQTKISINCYFRLIYLILPLIILQIDLKSIWWQPSNQYLHPQTDNEEINQHILIWSYLVTSAINNRLQHNEPNLSMMVKQVLSGVEVQTTSLVKKLEIVSQAWEDGLSLQKLAQELQQSETSVNNVISQVSSAIALSFYCFASTPRNFMLSIKRATKIHSELSIPITILTASVSGAYNGISNIPASWKIAASKHESYLQARETALKLFLSWLGIYNSGSSELIYNPDVQAVAAPTIFQSRQKLKIISQNSV